LNKIEQKLWRYGTPLSIVIALALAGVLFVAVGQDPIKVYASIAKGSIGTGYGISETILQAVPLLLISLGLCIAYKGRFWNIGSEGQYVMGAIAVTPLALYFHGLPSYVSIPILLVVSALVGGAYGAIAGVLRARLGVSEIITTLMMNFIAIDFLSYLTWGPLMGSLERTTAGATTKTGQPMSDAMPLATQLARILPQPEYRVNVGIILALALVAITYAFVSRTSLGYQIRVMGSNADAARAAGMGTQKITITVAFLSGAFAGLAGAAVLLGAAHRLSEGFATGLGYTGIMVTLLGKTNPIGALLAALFVAGLSTGSNFMYRTIGLPVFVVDIVIGFILLVMLAIEAVSRVRLR
jgi:ABC-type uncharacterized transport system permease subunit